MGTEYLIIILLWCGDPSNARGWAVLNCRKTAIECVSKLKNFSTGDVLKKCLLKVGDE